MGCVFSHSTQERQKRHAVRKRSLYQKNQPLTYHTRMVIMKELAIESRSLFASVEGMPNSLGATGHMVNQESCTDSKKRWREWRPSNMEYICRDKRTVIKPGPNVDESRGEFSSIAISPRENAISTTSPKMRERMRVSGQTGMESCV
ncbi:hypothetical protein OS493_022105 [Desmophyllum pertusum]|uniref:Uncharacterized protein n=1 Tax=Desmophyllum pertusum TaxID=174260 RepID=A0A9W9YMJ3_9CNID|nr:hypothetical protein OS493_022105 [Desmophyllum pertusum]